jgi:hypothetical protein
MAAYNKFNQFVLDLTNGAQDWDAHTFKVMLTNTAPVVTNAIKADIIDIAAGNGYTAGGTATAITTSQASGVAKVVATDVVFIASGGSIGPFRYVVLYNDTQATPAKPLVAWWDYGAALTLAAGESFTVDFDGTNGIWQLT